MTTEQQDAVVREVRISAPPELVFIPPGSTRVEVDLIAEGKSTLVRLTHRGLPAEAAEQHAIGWEHYLERLVVAGEGRDPGADPWLNPS